ncbi:MFS transporter [Methanohalophilus halophilus]|uniref:MFS transporter n=1 Tax=Methanohalophilus halophilus TaxID=2177 RepID=A0A1L3Q3W9_9EURY|nr:MFS transporter [Methanohalophilus halophilus]APH39574.1 MFS transporter [Methanohalophilus halophilus]RNI09094.1 MFS transporter [Methanohalophilus halophilus]SDW31452.1 Predicted arabinose efflux permease, MFS family [Methanohalophilus halophilus]
MRENQHSIDRQLYILSFSKIFKDLATGMLLFFIPLYAARLDVGIIAEMPVVLKAGIATAAFGIANSLSQPVMGRLSDRLNRRKDFLVVGYVIYTLLCLSYPYTSSLESLTLLRVIQGIAIGATVPAIVAMVTHLSTSSVRGQAIGIYSSLRGFAFGIGSIIAGGILAISSFDVGFYICGFLVLVTLILVQFFVKETAPPPKEPETVDHSSQKEYYILAIAIFMMMVGITIVLSLLPAYQQRLQTGEFYLSLAVSAYVISRIVFQTPMGILSDRIERKWIIISGIAVNALIVIGLGYVIHIEELIILRIMQGISMAAVETPLMALAVDMTGGHSTGSRISIITSAQAAGMATGPLFGGILAGYVSFETPFHICAILILISGLLILKGIHTENLQEWTP